MYKQKKETKNNSKKKISENIKKKMEDNKRIVMEIKNEKDIEKKQNVLKEVIKKYNECAKSV